MDNDNEKRMKEKLDFFLREKIAVHIEKKDKRFFNGLLIEKVSEKIYVLKDRVVGLVHIFVSDLWDVDEFQEDKKIPEDFIG